MKFLKSNPNPKGHKVGDCVVRAMTYATNQKWDDTYQQLCGLGFILKDMPNGRKTTDEFMKQKGFTKMKMPRRDDRTKYTVRELVEELHPKGTIVVQVANHTACVINGELLDLWDCSKKSVGNYFISYKK
jgi:hypothetical protein